MSKHETRGRNAIPAAEYLAKWNPVVDSIKAGLLVREIKAKHGIAAETIRHIRQFMLAEGLIQPEPAKVKRVPQPPKPRMTGADFLAKYPGIVAGLIERKTISCIAGVAGVSMNTVLIVKRALNAQTKVSRTPGLPPQ